MIRGVFIAAFNTAIIALALGCGTEEKSSDAGVGDYFPLAVGDTWLYEEDDGVAVTRVQYEVIDFATKTFGNGIGDKEVFFVKNTFPNGGGDTDSPDGWRMQYYLDDGTRIDRLRHEVYDVGDILTKTRDYDPGFLRFDRGKTVGDQWAEDFTRYTDSTPEITTDEIVTDETSYLFEVVGYQTVNVTAGEFNCVVWKRTETDTSGEIKLYYYAPDVGKVKEVTGDKVEQLVSCTVGGVTYGGV